MVKHRPNSFTTGMSLRAFLSYRRLDTRDKINVWDEAPLPVLAGCTGGPVARDRAHG